jgi:hypothetical protein
MSGLLIHWPGLSVERAGQHPGFPESVTYASVETAMNLHASLFSFRAHRKLIYALEGQEASSNEDSTRLYYKLQAIRCVNAALLCLQDPNFDESKVERIICSITALSSHEVEGLMIGPPLRRASPFRLPLADAAWISAYGALKRSPDHLKGMSALVTRRGGLEKIVTGGLAEVLS